MKTSVVIPYYQDEPGILRGAVLSALSQQGVSDLEVIVVDDGSPASARNDVANLDLPAHATLKLIEQPNRGPGAARNRGLDSVAPGTAYVAFLDSDDRWSADHLSHAVTVLSNGYDIYCSDIWSPHYGSSFFERRSLSLTQHTCIDPKNKLFLYNENTRCDAVNSINSFHLSTVVYRYDKFYDVRFPEIASMGDDLTFWMKIGELTSQIVFRANVEVFSDRGIHIYDSSKWGAPKCIWKQYHYMKWRKWLRKNVLKEDLERQANERAIRGLRRSFCYALQHEIFNGRAFFNAHIIRFFLIDPFSCLYFPISAYGALSRKIKKRFYLRV